MSTVFYDSYLETDSSFESVVDIDADKRNTQFWQNYIVGEDMKKLLECMCQSLGNESPDARRSFWIHGTYGTGKSYASIFVKHLLEDDYGVIEEIFNKKQELSDFKDRFLKLRKNGDYLVIWKTGVSGIYNGDMLLFEAEQAIQDALIEKYGMEKVDLGTNSLIKAVRDKLDDPSINWEYLIQNSILNDDYNGDVDALREDVKKGKLDAIQSTATVLREKKYGLVNNLETFKSWVADVIHGNGLERSGIFFIWDEFSEYVLHSSEHTILQQLSEFTKVQPLFMYFVVHKSREMVYNVGNDKYQQISHRFHEIEFKVSQDAAFELISNSIVIKTGMEVHWGLAKKRVVDKINPFLPDLSGLDDNLKFNILKMCPMHPMTIRLLSRVAESYAASQRTMFRFMKDTSSENLGFNGYISHYGPEDTMCWLTPDRLWDYFFTRESDFSEKETKVGEFIRHYESKINLVANDQNVTAVFKASMLLMVVSSTTKGIYSGRRIQGGIDDTDQCLINCFAGVFTKEKVLEYLNELVKAGIILLDTRYGSGISRLSLPMTSDDNTKYESKYQENEKKFSRYQLFSKDGVVSTQIEKRVWSDNDASYKRIKICTCCSDTNSIKTRLQEIRSELNKNPYKIGVLLVVTSDESQFMPIQSYLLNLSIENSENRLVIALLQYPYTEDNRSTWLSLTSKQEIAAESGYKAHAGVFRQEAETCLSKWINVATGSKIIAWNHNSVMDNIYGFANLQAVIKTKIINNYFINAPENIALTSTLYKACTENAIQVGISRTTNSSQFKPVLDVLYKLGIIDLKSAADVKNVLKLKFDTHGMHENESRAASAIYNLVNHIDNLMNSGQKVVLEDLWDTLQSQPFGYYNAIITGVLLGFVFSLYVNRGFSWIDSNNASFELNQDNMKAMVLNLCRGKLSTDYLAAGSITFQNFRQYAKKLFKLNDDDVASEVVCIQNIRAAITKLGIPFWTIKYLNIYKNNDDFLRSCEIIDSIQTLISEDCDSTAVMSSIIQNFSRSGTLLRDLVRSIENRKMLINTFIRFLFNKSPDLEHVAKKMNLQDITIHDRLQASMQSSVYTWTEDQVIDKLAYIVKEYLCLDAVINVIGVNKQTFTEVQKVLLNLFDHLRIPQASIKALNFNWYPALEILYEISKNGYDGLSFEMQNQLINIMNMFGHSAMECLRDSRFVLSNILESKFDYITFSADDLNYIYLQLDNSKFTDTETQFDNQINTAIGNLLHVRNKQKLMHVWKSISNSANVEEWCENHQTPIFWIANNSIQKALNSLIQIQAGNDVLDNDVSFAIEAFNNLDPNMLLDEEVINKAIIKLVGDEYAELIKTRKRELMTKIKIEVRKSYSTWDMAELHKFKSELNKLTAMEKLERTKSHIMSMESEEVKDLLCKFIELYPQYCDQFLK